MTFDEVIQTAGFVNWLFVPAIITSPTNVIAAKAGSLKMTGNG